MGAKGRETWVCNDSLGTKRGTRLETQRLVADEHLSLARTLAFPPETGPMGAGERLFVPFLMSVNAPVLWCQTGIITKLQFYILLDNFLWTFQLGNNSIV